MKKTIETNSNDCLLLLDNGKSFLGKGYGFRGDYLGEICFNTSITGYQEILTDPSYFKQIINFTFPHIGIVGSNKIDYESEKIFASACIINNEITSPSNFRSELDFEKWLFLNKKACITGVDTRVLAKSIRNDGALNCLIHFPHKRIKKISVLKKILQNFPSMKDLDLASEVTTPKIYQWKNNKKHFINFSTFKSKFLAIIDFGIKNNILNILESKGNNIIVFPCNYPMRKIISKKPEGFFLSNGPGDPKATFCNLKKELELLKNQKFPIFGICLGHQILSLLFGASTIKMHHGHRGANHPVKNHRTGTVEITVQNHGFVVSRSKLPNNIEITHSSLFDNTIAGIKIKNKPFFSVQYHPESSPGPQDSRYLFNQFKNLIRNNA
ncbi:MAG: carbamoyl phosphate synthase small subunit [Rickettsiales bacterium]|nr:carbamoyl phosphate synthase small subunit [Rickettsiales bacterium]